MSLDSPSGYGAIPSTTAPTQSPPFLASRAFRPTRRPWREFLNPSFVSLPISAADAMVRIRRSAYYFRVNYAMIMLAILFLSLLWYPLSMIVFLIVFALWWFLYFFRDGPVVILGRSIDDRMILAVLSLVTVICLILTDVGLNVLVALIIGTVVVALHAAFRGIDDLFVDEETAEEGGLLSVVASPTVRPSTSYSPI